MKLHVFVMLRPGQLPLLRAAQISPASCPDLTAAKQIDRDCAPVSFGRLFADRAYCDMDWADSLKKCREIQIITPRKRKRYDILRSGDCSHFPVSSARQPIESFFHWARACLINGGMPNGERFFRWARQKFAGILTDFKNF